MSDAQFLDLPPELSCDLATAEVALLPVPYDGTSTWKKGADRGPAAIIEASKQLELYDIETASEPFRHGILTLDEIRVDGPPEALVAEVERRTAEVLRGGRLPVVLGGEHSVTIGAVRAAAAAFPALTVLQIDAHADTRESYEGSPNNHACVMARARELCPVVQVGIRSVDTAEVPGLDMERVYWAHELDGEGAWIANVVAGLSPEVYVTIDLDAFDPSLMPATGTPEPGGMSWRQVTSLLAAVAASRRVVGFDVVELLPQSGDHACDFLAAKLVYRFVAMILAARDPRSRG